MEAIATELPMQLEQEQTILQEQRHIPEARDEPSKLSLRDRLLHTRAGNALTAIAASAGLGGAAELVLASPASAGGENTSAITSLNQSSFLAIGKSSFSESSIASGQVTFLQFIRARGLSRSQILKTPQGNERCIDVTGPNAQGQDWWNSGVTTGMHLNPLPTINQVHWYRDPAPGWVCRVPLTVSPTGWARKDCGNFMMPPGQMPPSRQIVTGRVVLVRSEANAHIRLHAQANATAEASCHTPDFTAQATAFGKGSATADVYTNLKAFVKAKGSALIQLSGKETALAKARASANAVTTCAENISSSSTTTTTPPPPPPPPGQQFPPTIEVQQKVPGFEGPFENGSDQICADATSNPTVDGVTVTFRAKYGQTTPAFPDGKPNEFCTIYTAPNKVVSDEDVTATATDNANGKQASDDTGQFPVMQDSFARDRALV